MIQCVKVKFIKKDFKKTKRSRDLSVNLSQEIKEEDRFTKNLKFGWVVQRLHRKRWFIQNQKQFIIIKRNQRIAILYKESIKEIQLYKV